MSRKLNKEERKILVGVIGKALKFAGTLSPEEIMLVSKLLVGLTKTNLEVDDD